MKTLVFLALFLGQMINTGPRRKVFGPSCIGCLAAWPMNEGTGLTFHDVSGNHDDAAYNPVGTAFTWQSNAGFPGTTPVWPGGAGTGYALASSTSLLNFDGTTPFSVSVWVQSYNSGVPGQWSSNTGNTLIGSLNASGGTFQGWELSVYQQHPSLLVINNYPSNALWVETASAISGGTVQNLVATYDGSRTPAGVKIYVNGVSQSLSTTTNTLSATAANGLQVRFAARNDANQAYSGVMAYVEVWGSVLSSSTISTYYAAGPAIH